MKNIFSIIFVLSFCFLSQTQVLHASYVTCPTGQYWDQLECKSIYQDCLSITGAVWQGNNSCACDSGYTTLHFGYISPNMHNHYFQLWCSPLHSDPVPDPITYCVLNQEYSFGVAPYIQQCTCPYGSHSVESLRQPMVGVHRFSCVSDYVPEPTPRNCWDDTYLYRTNSCEPYRYCSGDGKKYPLSHTCYDVTPTWQTCSDGSMIPLTSVCPQRTYCSYNQYWNGYSCADYYQPYYPTPYSVIDYQPAYNWEYNYDSYDYSNNDDFQSDFGWGY